jgi:hypothetical protein
MDSIQVYETLNHHLITDISKIIIRFIFISRSKPLYILHEFGEGDYCRDYELIGFYKDMHNAIKKAKSLFANNFQVTPSEYLKKMDLSLLPNCAYSYDEDDFDEYEKYKPNYDKYITGEICDDDRENCYSIENDAYCSVNTAYYRCSFVAYAIEKRIIKYG